MLLKLIKTRPMISGAHCELWESNHFTGSRLLAQVFVLNEHLPPERFFPLTATTNPNPNCSRLYLRGLSSISRSTPLSAREAQIRTRFSAVTRAVATRAKDLMNMTTDQANFLAQKDQPGGKKTMKSYLWSICAAAYDAEHNG